MGGRGVIWGTPRSSQGGVIVVLLVEMTGVLRPVHTSSTTCTH